MALSLPDLPVNLIYRILNFIPSKENAIIQVHETCRALALKTTELFARNYFSSGSWRLTRRTVSALTGISKHKYLNPALKDITLFRYTNEYEDGLRYSLAEGIDIKELGQSLQTLANLRSLNLADFNFRDTEKFLGDLLATLSLPSITDFGLLKVLVHASDIGKFITLHSNTIKTVVFDELDLIAPAKGAWSGLLSSLTCLKDVELIHIRKPLKCGIYVRFEPEDEEDPTFHRYVELDTRYDECGCNMCQKYSDLHWSFAEYRLGTDAEKEDWTRGLELMVAGSRTVDFVCSYGKDWRMVKRGGQA
ncbi:uncharacterized protein K441DRAFT_658295 [Cenococcum geophilum 1.58]|uniref:uncharacterized protein n=1 Tax=Cenococcum geophilum 1.58 TaxID=794803 RepID=UPI00358F8E24|nr:hypothetical protein K441DRAFT_658295 [Cenococcum geophilum 1.58]